MGRDLRGTDIHSPDGLRRLDMASYLTSVNTAWSPETAFDFMADLRNFAIWDPGVSSVRLVKSAGPGLGAAFDVDVHAGPRTITLRYETTEFQRPDRLLVVAATPTLISRDEIMVEKEPGGARVTYDAELSLRGVLRLADPLLAIAFRHIGERAAASLRRTLAGDALPTS
jgi:carbon monoxide dehydrogenase subunit G